MQARCLHLIMREDMRPIGQGFQPRMGTKRRDANDGVMPPIGPLIALPPGLPGGPGAHAVTHAELKQPRKSCLGRPAMNKLLQDRELRVRFHAGNQTQHGIRCHFRIRIQAEHEVMPIRVMIQKLHHIAGFETGILRAAPVMGRNGLRGRKGAARGFLGHRIGAFGCV